MKATLLCLALTACGGTPFVNEANLGDGGRPPDEAATPGDVTASADGAGAADALPGDHDAPELGAADVVVTGHDAGVETGAVDAWPDVVDELDAGPVDAMAPRPVCCDLGSSCHNLAATCPLAANGTPTCYCGSARNCTAADLGAYCYLINGCSGTLAWCPGSDQ